MTKHVYILMINYIKYLLFLANNQFAIAIYRVVGTISHYFPISLGDSNYVNNLVDFIFF